MVESFYYNNVKYNVYFNEKNEFQKMTKNIKNENMYNIFLLLIVISFGLVIYDLFFDISDRVKNPILLLFRHSYTKENFIRSSLKYIFFISALVVYVRSFTEIDISKEELEKLSLEEEFFNNLKEILDNKQKLLNKKK